MKRLVERIYYNEHEEKFFKGTITQKRILLMKKYLKFLNTITGILVLSNILLASVETEQYFGNKNKSTDQTDALRITIMIISLLLCVLVILDYNIRLRIEILEMKTTPEDTLVNSKKIYLLLIELSIMILCCPP